MALVEGMAFVEVATELYVLRHPELDVNSTLVVGGEVAAVVDTLSTDAQARELLDAVRAVTNLPLVVVNTHFHFDHSYGNAVLTAASPGCSVWAHERAVAALRDHGTLWQRAWYEEWLPTHPELAEGIAAVTVRAPDRTVSSESLMDIGGRILELRHLGRGHTDGDLVVAVPDAGALLAGDLVEQGAAPAFEDSYPIDWPETVAALLHLTTPATTVVPGHGRPVDVDFVRAQHEELADLAKLIREGHSAGVDPAEVAAKAPFAPEVALTAVTRGYAELAGSI
jgi:glyoxylase-like metal-dependent hydrolase (beta-lactamase superfamily II)